jgi:outer membrane protein OmpU
MKNLKKLGLTALAGSMVAISAQAVEMSVSGSAVMTFVNKSGSVDATDTGSGWGMDKGMGASASGELDNGWGVSLYHGLSPAGNETTSSITVNLGDAGSIAYVQADLGGGAEALDDVMPTAHEEPSNGLGTTAAPLASAKSAVSTGFVYSNSIAGASVSINYAPDSAANVNDQGASAGTGTGDASSSIGITYPVADTGLTIYAAKGTDGEADGKNHDHTVLAATYAMGPATIGVQRNEKDDEDASASDYTDTYYAISFAVNDDLSISYGRQDTEKEGSAIDQEVTGISVGYSMGGMTISAHSNKSDNHNNVAGATSEHQEIALTFAF